MDSKTAMGNFRTATGITPKLDGALSVVKNKLIVDLLALDKQLANHDPEYNNIKCTYKGKPDYSMNKYIEEKWGSDVLRWARIMLDLPEKENKNAQKE